ncbi:MAG TPA: hypothetical protein VF981_00120 [Gemmatimonadaceae bacterium]
MPTRLPHDHSTLIIRRAAYEAAGIVRAGLDARLRLTDDEFRVDGGLVVVGPILEGAAVPDLIAALEEAGLVYFDDFFEVSGNWPDWLSLIATDGGRTPSGA